MSTERMLLAAACGSRAAESIIYAAKEALELTQQGGVVLDAVHAYYARDGRAERVDMTLLAELVKSSLPNSKHHPVFERFLELVKDEVVSPENVAALVAAQRRVSVGARLATAILADDLPEVAKLQSEYALLVAADDAAVDGEVAGDILVAPTLRDAGMTSDEGGGDLIRVFPLSLNSRLGGGMRRGHHAVVFARPEMGKTTLVVNMAYGFLKDGHRVLYISNEEPVVDTVLRIKARIAGVPGPDIVRNEASVESALYTGNYRNFAIQRMYPGTLAEIETALRANRPDVLILDQLRNVRSTDDSMTRQLERVAAGVRQLAGKYDCLAISVTQAGDSASGKGALDMGDVDSSNTGVPGACDVMIGLGGTNSDITASRRIISLPKNKRTGDHGFFPVRVDLSTFKVTSL